MILAITNKISGQQTTNVAYEYTFIQQNKV